MSAALTLDSERAVRLLDNWGFERRQQDRQMAVFQEQLVRIRATSDDAGATAAVFHGTKQLSRRERLLQEHREQVLAELRKKDRRVLAVRRGTGERVFCRHCNQLVRAIAGRKCERCKKDPDLITARGTETRSYVARPEVQPPVAELSENAKLIEAIVDMLAPRGREVLERRYLDKSTDQAAAEEMGISVAMFAGIASAATAEVARKLATFEYPRV